MEIALEPVYEYHLPGENSRAKIRPFQPFIANHKKDRPSMWIWNREKSAGMQINHYSSGTCLTPAMNVAID